MSSRPPHPTGLFSVISPRSASWELAHRPHVFGNPTHPSCLISCSQSGRWASTLRHRGFDEAGRGARMRMRAEPGVAVQEWESSPITESYGRGNGRGKSPREIPRWPGRPVSALIVLGEVPQALELALLSQADAGALPNSGATEIRGAIANPILAAERRRSSLPLGPSMRPAQHD